jgi:hypothetical protein
MLGCLKSIVGKALILAGLVLAAYGGWRWGPQVFPMVHEWLGLSAAEETEVMEPSPELADSVLARLQEYRRGGMTGSLALGSTEVTSVLRHALPGFIPEGITKAEVRLEGGRVYVQAEVALDAFPELPDLGAIVGFLPDTLDVGFEGSLMPFGDGRSALMIHGLEASRIPLPRRLIPEILKAMGRKDEQGLPPEAVVIPLPSGLGAAYILTDSLILSHDP